MYIHVWDVKSWRKLVNWGLEKYTNMLTCKDEGDWLHKLRGSVHKVVRACIRLRVVELSVYILNIWEFPTQRHTRV